ncbi:MAG: hypothetical protein ACFFCW_18375 [Candidatus Hodarchaeota archaeon]
MKREDLQKIALREASRALGLTDVSGYQFEQRGSTTEWDDGVYKNIFEVIINVWKPVAIVDIELDAKTGEVFSWYDKIKVQESGEGILSKEEAIQIARASVTIPENVGPPQVSEIIKNGRIMMLVVWKSRISSLKHRPRTVEVIIHPGTKKVCSVRQF